MAITPLNQGGTGSDLSATGGASQVLKQVGTGANVTVGQLAAGDLSNAVTGSGKVVLASDSVISPASVGKMIYLDGVTYTTIAAAISGLGGNGGSVLIPPGYTETVTSTIVVPANVK